MRYYINNKDEIFAFEEEAPVEIVEQMIQQHNLIYIGDNYDPSIHKIEDGTIVEKSEQERIQELQQLALGKNLREYQSFCDLNDREIEKYRKRSELGILDEDDEREYQQDLEAYKQATLEYRARKAAIMTMTQAELETYLSM